MTSRKPFDFWIFITILVLLSLGIIMVFSASAPAAYTWNNDIYYFLKNQLMFALIGFVAMFFAMNTEYRRLAKFAVPLLIISIVMLILVLIPGIGEEINGSRRWLNLGITNFQPSELGKLALILFLANSLSKRKDQLQSFTRGLVPYLLVIGVVAGLIVVETHLSATIIIILVTSIILFSAGARLKHFALMAVPVLAIFALIIYKVDYMKDRVLSFLNPFAYSSKEGFQAVQSLYAIGSGGLFGRGLGKSLQKFLYLPFPYNDFIFSVMAEEQGFVGVLVVMLLFLIFIWRGVKVSMCAPDVFGSLLALGITSLIAVQALLNIAVVTSSCPNTGVALPFFSSGGTSLVFFMTEVGILLNISRYSNYERM
jgi:cell division protein FtsW